IVPTHNRADLLKRLLNSFREQTYPHDRFEVIVVHNRSNDSTVNVVDECAATARFPVHYFLKDYSGPMPSRQFGYEQAPAGIVTFIDDDCIAMPRWLEAGVAAFHDDIGLIQ